MKDIWDKITHLNEVNKKEECFYVENEVLMRKSRKFENEESEISVRRQVVVPKIFRNEILSLGHESLFAGHQGRTKTYERVVADFFWPRMFRDTEEYCRTCHVCQVTGKPNQTIPPAPLKLVPITGEAFSKVLMDIVGPLPKTSNGNQYLLTIMCVNTRFPEAIPLRKVTAAVVAKALLKYFTMTGLPQEIQTDQGSNFMSKLCQQVLALLDIKQVRSSAFHPASLGALERYAKQESLGFSPFELVYGHTPRGPLKLVKDSWLQENSSDELLDYVARIKDRLWQATELAKKHLLGAQSRIKGQFDRKAKVREFRPGDKVLLYLPIPKSSLQSKYFGPYTVNRKV
ncbi:integrase, partial [Solemya velum gill symbiont]|uniref:integrase n=1 Tax=Solemya velum gill symbiont TaxID=2340 RepID=UPI0011842A4A